VDSYRGYVVDGVTPIAAKSTDEGKRLLALLQNTKKDTPEGVQKAVSAIGREADTLVSQAEDLNPPEKLGAAHRSLILALQYRANGIKTLAAEIPNAAKSKDRTDAASKLATPMGRVLTSDFLYKDSFVEPARQALEDDNVDGVEVPESALLAGTSNANKAGPAGARAVLTALGNAAAGSATPGATPADGTLRGTGIVAVKVLPGGKQLANGVVNEIVGSADNKWEVTIENGGQAVETGITITASLTGGGLTAPQRSTAPVDTIDIGETKSVQLDMGSTPEFDQNATLTIEVSAVPNETRSDNNTAKYTVQFKFQ
jgi:hypothetical protein